MERKYFSIPRRLTLVNTVISGVALLLAGLALVAYDQVTLRQVMARDLSIQAHIVATNSISTLVFHDPSAAAATLSALSAAPQIVSAAIYTSDGSAFATYTATGVERAVPAVPIPAGQSGAQQFDDQHLVLSRRVVFQGKEIGRVSIARDLQELSRRRDEYIGIVAAVWIAALLTALVMSWLFHRAISGPLTQLAGIARQVSAEKDYSVRAVAAGRAYEIAVLADAFNGMLTQIQERDRSLRQAQDELEDRVRERTAELDAANKDLESFSYSVSHDLRAPLRHVVGFASMLEGHAKDALDATGRKHLATITAAATRMGQLIDDLLTFSRMGRSQLAKQRVRLDALVADAQKEVTTDGGAGRSIDWQIEKLPDVDADPAMLRLVMVNLLSNAVKYSAPRDVARIAVGVDHAANGEVAVFVRDNGVGFDMQYAHKLFGVFQRLHGADEFEGTGVGLANVARIIHRHGGRVWAHAIEGRGATFYFSLPTKGTRREH